MKTQTRKFRSISIITLFFIGIVFSASLVSAFNLFGTSLERFNNEGAVKVTAEYLPPKKSKIEEISFRLVLDTHSVNLEQYDIQQLSSLIIDNGAPIEASKWQPTGASHHFNGVLSFSKELPSEEHTIKLIVKNIDNVEERVFEWQLPLKK